jgi:hypothetical protein
MLICLKLDAELVVEDPQVAVVVAYHGLRHDRLHFLRYHADVCAVAAIITEAIVTQAVLEIAEKDDIVLEAYIGPSSAAATAAASTTAASASAAAEATATATAACSNATAATAVKTCAPASRLPASYSA